MLENISATMLTIKYIIYGLCLLPIALVFLLITVPVIAYRTIIAKLVPIFSENIASIVDANGQSFAVGVFPRQAETTVRSTIVVSVVLDQTLENEACRTLIQERWIDAVDNKSGQLQYPELQQYIVQRMGFMFWKQDTNFDIQNHLIFHQLDPHCSPSETSQFENNLIEELLNKPYLSRRSPWELYFISNVNYPELKAATRTDKPMLVVLRFHHAMVDGFSILQLIANLSEDNDIISQQMQPAKPLSTTDHNLKLVKLAFKWLHDAGKLMSTAMSSEQAPWYCPYNTQIGRQLYYRSPLIPIDRIKFIKNKLGCKFASVLLSCISKGAAYSIKAKGSQNNNKIMHFGVVLPLPGHPNRLCNHWALTILQLPLDMDLDSHTRLKMTEENYQDAAFSSLFPKIHTFIQKILSVQFAQVTEFLYKNYYFSSGMTNFRASELPQILQNCRIITGHSCVGLPKGIAGVVFSVVSIADHACVAVAADNRVMNRTEMKELVDAVCNEIDELFMLANDQSLKKYNES